MRPAPSSLLLLAALSTGCTTAHSAPDDSVLETATEPARVELDEHGRLRITGASGALNEARWFVLRPAGWPVDGVAPVVASGRVRVDPDGGLYAEPWVYVARGGLSWLELEAAQTLTPPPDSKVLVEITGDGSAQVMIPLGTENAVGVGDTFFALDLDSDPSRLGDAIVALLEVTQVNEDSATAHVRHGSSDGADLAFFAQPARRAPQHEARIAAALLTDEVDSPAVVPALAAGVPDLLGRYAVSNVSFGALTVSIDPADDDAIERAAESAPGGVFGAIVVGRVEGDGVVLNAGAWGPSVGRGGSVGILPGGLHVPGDVALVAQSYAPALVASVLAQRGDDATALYLLERELREADDMPSALRYHLREHLAMRYDAIGQTLEALALMNHDVEQARASEDLRALMNALSIRTYLHQQLDQYEAAQRDSLELLTLADGVLPEAALLGERLGYARAMLSGDRRDEALAQYAAIRGDAERLGDRELALIAAAEMAQVQAAEDGAAAALAIEELLAAGDLFSDGWRVSLLLSAAEWRASIDDRDGALRRLSDAFALLPQLDSLLERAYGLRRAARITSELELGDETVGLLTEAMRTMVDVGDPEGIATTAMELGSAQLRFGLAAGGPAALTMINAAQDSLMTAWALLTQSAQLGAAAEVLSFLATLRGQMGDIESSDLLFERAARYGMVTGDYALVADVFQAAARLARDSGDLETARTLRDLAASWAAPRNIELWLPPLPETTPDEAP